MKDRGLGKVIIWKLDKMGKKGRYDLKKCKMEDEYPYQLVEMIPMSHSFGITFVFWFRLLTYELFIFLCV